MSKNRDKLFGPFTEAEFIQKPVEKQCIHDRNWILFLKAVIIPKTSNESSNEDDFFHYQISWIFVINQVICVSSCWGRRHTPVICNESREPHTSNYPSILFFLFISLSDIMDLRDQSSAMCIIMLGRDYIYKF